MDDIDWQEAVARLAHERALAITCAALLKKYGDMGAVDRGALAYAEAKAEYDSIVAGLVVALARRDEPSSLPDLEERLREGCNKRVAFCENVQRLLPRPTPGQKSLVTDIVSGAVGPLIDALKAIWLRARDDNALIRKTIETQLEATVWPEFRLVSSEP